MNQGHTGSRRFPSLAWAWPAGALDQLITAAIGADPADSQRQFRDWLSLHDIDQVSFREHRLLAAIAARFGKALSDQPEYPRLVGLQRQLWTRSRMAFARATPLLQQLVAAGVPVMLIKGGARIAVRASDQTARVAHDLDILVPSGDFGAAMKLLFNAGWAAASGESQRCLQSRVSTIRAMNFFDDRLGDIDLHQWAYGDAVPTAHLESGLWQSAKGANFLGVPVRVPSPTDRLALAICHSGLDAHAHSDWLIDCAQLITDTAVDWDRLLTILADTGAQVQAQVALSYLAQRIGVNIPAQPLGRLMAAAGIRPLQRMAYLLQAKPRTDSGWVTRLARGVAKQIRLRAVRQRQPTVAPLRGRLLSASQAPIETQRQESGLQALLPLPASATVHFTLDLRIHMTGARRRFEFELNTDQQHLLRLRVRSGSKSRGQAHVRFEGTLQLPEGIEQLWVESRPGKQLRAGESAEQVDRYAAAMFTVLQFDQRSLR